MKLYTHTITVVQTKTYVFELQSESEEIDAMSYGMELMSEIDKGDNEYLVSDQMTWEHSCDETSGNPKCSTVTGDAWKLELVDEPPEFLRQCKNCERIMRS